MTRSGQSLRRPGSAAALVLLGLAIAAPALSGQVRVRFGVPTPMRDGVKLVSDMWMPEGKGPFPTILVRTPYERTMELIPSGRPPELDEYFARHGYVWMIQDTRGRGDSEGSFASSAFPFIDVNPNTGLPPATDTTARVAHQTIHHDHDRLSFVELPVWKRP